jgi:hypothetical protein
MFILSPQIVRSYFQIYCSHHYQSTSSSLSSILFPEPTPKSTTDSSTSAPAPSVKATTKQHAQAVVSSAADAAVHALDIGLDALNAVSNRLTGFTSNFD